MFYKYFILLSRERQSKWTY